MKEWSNPLSPGFCDVLRMVAVIAIVVAVCFIAGCSHIAPLSDAEVISCRNEGCAAFTENEILTLMGRAFKDGYQEGWRDFARQTGRRI